MESPIKVTYKHTRNAYTASKYLQEIKQHDLFAADFEAAVKYTAQDYENIKAELLTAPTKRRRIELESILKATALDHPSHVTLTHCSIALNDHEGYVFILDNKAITNLVLTFLVTTNIRQIWHNASFDFKHILYHTGKLPINFEDTQIFAKTILNHVEVWKANTGLKELAGHKYGAWGISEDKFDISHMYDPQMLLYSATDACATYWLYHSILNHVSRSMNVYNIQDRLVRNYRLPVTKVTYNWQKSDAYITYYNIVTDSENYFELRELHDGIGNSRLDVTELEEHLATYYPELLI